MPIPFMSREQIMGRTFRSADIETDGFNPTKVHCLSITDLTNVTQETRSFTVTTYDRMRDLMAEDVTWIFHNGHSFDKPALEKLMGVPMKGDLIDTLAVSWYLYPLLQRHGLAYWGEELGFPKPEVDDWIGLDLSVYVNRCESDVKIQTLLWQQMWKHLVLLYGNEEGAMRVVKHVSYKLEVMAIQEKAKWKLDKPAAEELHVKLTNNYEEACVSLESHMPQVPVYAIRTRPKKCYKVSGGISTLGQKWYDLCKEEGHDPEDGNLEIKIVVKYKEPNAGSPKQLKDWLFDLGWQPTSFEIKVNKETKEKRSIPQIKDKRTDLLCTSVERMIDRTPALAYLRTMSVEKHRMGVVGGFLKNVDINGYVTARTQGFTNTLRHRHKECVNLPSARKPYGLEIRALLTARSEEFELCGSDMASLEDRTKQHYMWEYDPEYVKEMMSPDFDPHLDMAIAAGLVTPLEAAWYKQFDKHAEHSDNDLLQFSRIGRGRHAGKSCNYAATYGAHGPTIALAAGVPVSVGDSLFDAYWNRNWSLKAIADACIVKQSRGMKWLWNPMAKMWIFLKVEKDKFSTLNQSSGTFAFDMWVMEIMSRYRYINAQFHDEVIIEVRVGKREQISKILNDSMTAVNDDLKLNRELGCDIDFGNNYSEIH